jgi:hypothetical protein
MLKRGAAPKLRRLSSLAAAQETELARRTRLRDEAVEQLSAPSEVLKVISESAGEFEPVRSQHRQHNNRCQQQLFSVFILV